MIRFVRRAEVTLRTGKPTRSIYDLIAAGLFTAPVPLGGTSVGWPDFEVDAICAARLAGKTDAEIRALVEQLEAKRADYWVQLEFDLDSEKEEGPC